MRIISWNVNGLRACIGKGFMQTLQNLDPDVICLQEIKLQEGQLSLDLPEYHQYWNYAVRPGYSGTAIFLRKNHYHYLMVLELESTIQRGGY